MKVKKLTGPHLEAFEIDQLKYIETWVRLEHQNHLALPQYHQRINQYYQRACKLPPILFEVVNQGFPALESNLEKIKSDRTQMLYLVIFSDSGAYPQIIKGSSSTEIT